MKFARLFLPFIPATLALVAAGCGSSSSPAAPSGPTSSSGPASVTVNIIGEDGSMSFSPATVTVKTGQTVAWHNSDSITHAPAQNTGQNGGGGNSGYGGGQPSNGGFGTGDLGPGTTSGSLSFSNPGTYAYHCNIHPTMTGTLVVTP
jgi:plastocyanin